MNFEGILLGAGAFLCIGLFHPLVIKAEYYFGVKSWWAFLIVGLLAAVGSLFVGNTYRPSSWVSLLSRPYGVSAKCFTNASGSAKVGFR